MQVEMQNCGVMWCFVCLLSSLLRRLDVGRKWCMVQAEEEERETWGDEWVNVCTLFDVSPDLEHNHGWIPWLLMSDLSTGFCYCAKGINSVYGSASASSTAILLSLEGWDTVHLYLSCYFWLSSGVITKANLSLSLSLSPQLKLEDRSVVPRDVVRHMSSSVSAFFPLSLSDGDTAAWISKTCQIAWMELDSNALSTFYF